MMRSSSEEGLIRVSKADQDILYKKVNEFIENKSYNFKQLVSIYYDMSVLGRLNKTIRDEIYEKLNELIEKNSLRTLAIFNLLLILRALTRIEEISVKDLQIYNKVATFIE